MVFEDNFDGTALDQTKWNYHYRWGRTHNHQGYSQEANVQVSDGTLKLVCTPTANNAALAWPKASQGGTMPANFSTGVINSKTNFTYGYYEIRVKMPLQKGVWPAFWMAAASGAWPPEIDIFEYPWLLSQTSAPTQGFMNVHWGTDWSNKTASGGWYGSGINSGFHTFAVNWTPTRMEYYLDGVCVTSKNTTTLVNSNIYFRDHYSQFKDMYMILNFGMGGDWPGIIWDNAGYTETKTEVDYIRVWQRMQPVEGGNYILQNMQDGKVIDVSNESTAEGATFSTYTYKGSSNQFFGFEVLGNNYWKLTPLHSSKPMSVQNQSTADNAPIVQNTWGNQAYQIWQPIRQYHGVHRLVNKNSGKVAALGTGVEQQTWNGAAAQQWRTVYCDGAPVSNTLVVDAEYLICVKSSTKPIEIASGSTSNSVQVTIRNFDNAPYQKWRLTNSGVSGYYKIVNTSTGKLLTVRGGSTANNAVVEQNADLNNDSQRWQIVSTANGYYRIVNKGSGKAIDIGGGVADGAPAQQYSYWGGDNQQFCLTMVNRSGTALKSSGLEETATSISDTTDAIGGLFTAYVNPNDQSLVIVTGDANQLATIRITDMKGRLVYQTQTVEREWVVARSELGGKGLYLLNVTVNGKQGAVKFVVR